MGFHSSFAVTFFSIFTTSPGEGLINTTRNNYPFLPRAAINILLLCFWDWSMAWPIAGLRRAWQRRCLLFSCWLPAVGSMQGEKTSLALLLTWRGAGNSSISTSLSILRDVTWTLKHSFFPPSWCFLCKGLICLWLRLSLLHTWDPKSSRDDKMDKALAEGALRKEKRFFFFCIKCYYQQARPHFNMWAIVWHKNKQNLTSPWIRALFNYSSTL